MKYDLMHKTYPVLSMELDEGTGTIISIGGLYAPERLPVGIPCSGGMADRPALNAWWAGRSIPASREGVEEALFALDISTTKELLAKCFGLSLSDQYWV